MEIETLEKIFMYWLALLIIVSLLFLGFIGGVYYTRNHYESDFMILGLWQRQTENKTTIKILTGDMDIIDIIDTARHEVCHEIYYRVTKLNDTVYSHEDSEEFARKCNPKEYYWLDNGEEKRYEMLVHLLFHLEGGKK